MEKTKRPTLAFGCSVLGGLLLYYAMMWLQPALPRILFGYQFWLDHMITSPTMKFYWMIGDMTEPFFFKSLLGGVGLLIGSILAYQLDKRKSRYRLTPITYGYGKLWPWLFAASFLSLLIVTILFGNIRNEEPGWVANLYPLRKHCRCRDLEVRRQYEILIDGEHTWGVVLNADYDVHPIYLFRQRFARE